METLTAHTLTLYKPDAGQDAAPAPAFALEYDGKAITDSISRVLKSISYTDKTAGEADELEVELEDSVGNFRRLWYPEKGARLRARIGWPGQLLDCGVFEIDEVQQAGPPDVVTMRALAAGLTKASLRTKRSKAHESQTLQQIAEKVAKAHGLTVQGTIRPVTIQRATQLRSRDLKFLKKLALEYGYVFSVRGTRLVFTDVYNLEKSRPVLTLERKDITQYRFTDKVTNTYTAAEVSYHNPKTKKVVKGRAASAGGKTSADTLQLRGKAENKQQADAQARAALHWHNSRATECAVSLPGSPVLVAGVTVRLGEDFGAVAGLYYVLTSTHRLSVSDGYETEFTGKRLGN